METMVKDHKLYQCTDDTVIQVRVLAVEANQVQYLELQTGAPTAPKYMDQEEFLSHYSLIPGQR